ncbi:hypothetical protein [Aquimarina algiphila]|uniref:hypothetical protein n=1 Tax=Aquimarina algiphila TaxID=2047982 RepID=UPI00232B2FF5|nr:hypothetical protein [Aquimarina algiphila]
MIKYIKIFSGVLFLLLFGCKKEKQEQYNLFENSKVRTIITYENLVNYSLDNSRDTMVLEYILSFDNKNMIDEEYWERVLFEFNYDLLNNEEIEIPSNLIKLYGQLVDNRGRIEFKNFKGKIKISKSTGDKYIMNMLDSLKIDVKYNDSITRIKTLFNKGDDLIFK